jgi:ligand-binding SRPBCC domain-containing protein
MTTTRVETVIAAPAERCFLLSLSIDLHVDSASRTGERAVGGVTSGLIHMGQRVTWEGRHFGIRQRFTSEITACECPDFFQDTMVSGAFATFQHDHIFEELQGKTRMIDELRNNLIREVAGSSAWMKYLPDSNR